MKEQDTEIRVYDRRMFNPDGTLREGYKEAATTQPKEAKKQPTTQEQPKTKRRPEGVNRYFAGLIEMLTMNALIHLGGDGQLSKPGAVNLEAARDFVEMLAALEEKTKDNLSIEEERFLADMLARLRIEYVSVANKISASAKKQTTADPIGKAKQ
ncbi:MAG: DUF1844 domain-containing protein [Acidobacteriota bacterium]|nr:DUF1844 domain-containing protein [Blastocatellia bacterium]MDW8411486.1 DUF1844 domain-containing protein [Acidobacteriota bacterium]